ncbi:unnamed protein product, partial [Ectocarpus sp. 12 AP-2014]
FSPQHEKIENSPTGWMETTYLNQGIRIARGNKGSIFVLTRQ